MNLIKSIIAIACLFSVNHVFSQTVYVNGHITDMHGNNLFAVNIYLQKQTNIGTTSDFDGKFSLAIPSSTISKDEYLVISFIGYNTKRILLDSINFSIPLSIMLGDNAQSINEIVVKGRKSISREFALKELDKMKIYLSPLASADPLKALATLPSSTNTDETANPELRGSAANRTRVILNGVPIRNPVRNSQLNGIGFFSLLNTEMIKNEFIYPSNPPLTYGNTSAGLIDIESEDKLGSNSYQISTTLASSGVNVSQKMNEKSFIQLYGNLMYSKGFLYVNPTMGKRLKGFESNDFGLNYHLNLSDRASVNFYNYFVSECSSYQLNMFTWEDNAKANTLRDFSIFNLKYNTSNNFFSLNLGSNFQKSGFRYGNISSSSKQSQLYASVNYKHLFSERISLQAGVSNDYAKFSINEQAPQFYYAMSPTSPTYSADTLLKNNLPEGYLYFRWNPFRKFIWIVGMRKNLDLNRSDDANYLSLQTSLRYNFHTDNSLFLSVGKYHNYSEPGYGQKEFRLLSAEHYAMEYIYEKKATTINLAAYYKTESGELDGSKNIRGVEIFLERQLLKNFKASISNTILDSDVTSQEQSYRADNNVGYFLVTTLSYFNNRVVNVSVSWSNRQGKLYTPIRSSVYNPTLNFYEPIYSDRINSQRYNAYHTINLSFSRMFKVLNGSLISFISVNNVLNTNNQRTLNYNRDYSQSTNDYYQKRTVYFGCVLAFK
ncbi:MAG: hypothetical protein EHM93_07245 [Bacteroidales bacterium]|nr:MAG: hypothetical protein EHM93_07245 [Bacteroidales bacterium]